MKLYQTVIFFIFIHGINSETEQEERPVWNILTDDVVITIRFRNGQYNDVLELIEKRPEDFFDVAKKWFKHVIDKKEYNIPGCLLFSLPDNMGLPALTLSANMYPLLYEQMLEDEFDDSTYMVTLVYHVKLCIDHPRFHDLSEESQAKLTNLKNKFPIGIKTLLWNRIVTIRSVLHKDFVLQGDKHGQLYTRAGANNFTSWSVNIYRPLYKTITMYFAFENTKTGLVPYSDRSEARLGKYVFAESTYWRMIPENNASAFFFQNKINDRYLDVNSISSCGDVRCTFVHAYYRKSGVKTNQLWSFE